MRKEDELEKVGRFMIMEEKRIGGGTGWLLRELWTWVRLLRKGEAIGWGSISRVRFGNRAG